MEEYDGLETREQTTTEAMINCGGMNSEWEDVRAPLRSISPLADVADSACCFDQFKDTMLESVDISGTAYCVRMGMSKSKIMQDLLSKPDLAARFRNLLILMMIESVIPFCSMEVERIFSAHNLVKSTLRTRLAIENSSAQTKLMRKRQVLGPFGEPKMVCTELSL